MTQVIIWNTFIPDDNVNSGMRTLGPYRLAGWLREHGYTCQVIEYAGLMSTDVLVDITEQYISSETICMGVSSNFWYEWKKNIINYRSFGGDNSVQDFDYMEPDWVIKARVKLESRYPKLEWILGGAGVTSPIVRKQEYFKWQKFYGPSENSVLKWLDERTYKKYFAPPRSGFDICGARHCFTANDHIESWEVLPLELARGCQFRCKFCRYPNIGKARGTYIRDSKLIEQELLHNYNNFGTTRYFITDDTINETDEKITDLANIAQSLPFELEWVGYNRLDLIGTRPHTARILRDSGLRSPFFGIETFHPDSSKIIGKGWNGLYAQEWLQKLGNIWGKEVNIYLGFIIGIGDESQDDIWRSQEWCEKNIRGQWIFAPLSILNNPGDKINSSLFDRSHDEYGYYFPDPSRYWYWENNTWTWSKAMQFSLQVNNSTTRGYQHTCFGIMAHTASSGYSFKELMNTRLSDIDLVEVGRRYGERVDRYIEAVRGGGK